MIHLKVILIFIKMKNKLISINNLKNKMDNKLMIINKESPFKIVKLTMTCL